MTKTKFNAGAFITAMVVGAGALLFLLSLIYDFAHKP